ncbi:Two-component response regulator ARR18 [Platanthera guangdongensis]|uniref:Two-component response regulator ARR18 n=1 Tax=Platanthera guangdongensis TaxID=2320717 RepID=A0ABR2MIF2_9ASPA
MGSLVPELGLDLMLFTKRTIIGCVSDKMPAGSRAAKLEDLTKRLEEERRKIEAFKRELPLCMVLLADVIGGLKLEVEQCQRGVDDDVCVIEEFIPIQTRSNDFEEEKKELDLEESKDKMEWMSSAQLWSDNLSDESVDCKQVSHEKSDTGCHGRRDGDVLSLESKSGGAFTPFKAMPAPPRKDEEKLSISLPDLSLVTPTCVAQTIHGATIDDGSSSGLDSKAVTIASSSSAGEIQLGLQHQQHPSRKARRCWSPELHRRFIIALQQLGGAQVATPKQIRELMKVDGLTNDEVKSHLQKYRLHTRRMPNSSTNQENRPVVTLAGLWVSQDHCPTSQQNTSQSGSPQGPLQLALAGKSESYSCEEDGKSDSFNWK